MEHMLRIIRSIRKENLKYKKYHIKQKIVQKKRCTSRMDNKKIQAHKSKYIRSKKEYPRKNMKINI